jgi:Tfp pilus assembly protein PilZ
MPVANEGPAAAAPRFNPRREYIRHTAGVPITVRAAEGGAGETRESMNVSRGGLSFATDHPLAVGDTIQVRIDEVDPPFQARARVAWTSPKGGCWCVGVQFLDATDAFRARMVEQVCSIERYRREVEEREGRVLNTQEAAAEWIGRYAGRFPDSWDIKQQAPAEDG